MAVAMSRTEATAWAIPGYSHFHPEPTPPTVPQMEAMPWLEYGILGGLAKVEGVQGTWADLMKNVNASAFIYFEASH